MDGKQPAFVIGGNIFVSVTPIVVTGYAILEAFNPHRTIAAVVVQRFHLDGQSAELVRQTFRTARSGRNTALSLSVGARDVHDPTARCTGSPPPHPRRWDATTAREARARVFTVPRRDGAEGGS